MRTLQGLVVAGVYVAYGSICTRGNGERGA